MAGRTLYAGLLVAAIVALGVGSLAASISLQKPASLGIGEITFEPSAKDRPDQRAGTVVLVAARKTSYGDAYAELLKGAATYCEDGRGYAMHDTVPDTDIPADQWAVPSYPVGTRFSQGIHCQGPLPNPVQIAAGISDSDAEEQVRQALLDAKAGRASGTDGEVLVAMVPFDDNTPKYRAFDLSLGAFIRSFAHRRCADGHPVVRRIAVGHFVPPRATASGVPPGDKMLVGTDLACLTPEAPPG